MRVARVLSMLLVPGLLAAADPAADPDGMAPGSAYALPWWTLDSGGGLLIGIAPGTGTTRLDASIGQSDANPAAELRGGRYALHPGFWTPRTGQASASLFADGFESN